MKRVRWKDLKQRSGLLLVLRLALRTTACALLLTGADNPTAHAATDAGAEDESLSCGEAVAAAEVSFGIPSGLLQAVARVESGRQDPKTGAVVAWPWTLNVEGEGQFHASKAEALTALHRLRDRGIGNVDVGCMQINLIHHQGVFTSLEQALDPKQNVGYGASFLRALYAATGSWSMAVNRYHSATPGLGEAYGTRVMAVWRELGGGPTVLQLPPVTSAAGRYIHADIIARILTDAGIPVPTEILYMQMRGGLPPSGSATPRNGREDLHIETDEGSDYDVTTDEGSAYDLTTARERFVNPWAPPTDDEDPAVRTRFQSRSAPIGDRSNYARFGASTYGGARDEGMDDAAPARLFDRRRGFPR